MILYKSRVLTFLITFGLATVSSAAQWSAPTRIQMVQVIDTYNIVRVQILPANPPSNPAQCIYNIYYDIQLDADGRSAEQQRQLLNSINMAFITRRQVLFALLDDPNDPASCSTAGTQASIPIATGIRVNY